MAKKQFSLNVLQSRIKSDKELTTEDSAREAFWTPTSAGSKAGPAPIASNKSNKSNEFNISNLKELDIKLIDPDPNQPRKQFYKQSMDELKKSIEERGVEQPIAVRPIKGGRFMIVAGERRWRASTGIGHQTIPAIIKEMDDNEAFLSAFTENVQREELHFLDEAQSYKTMIDRGIVGNQAKIAERTGVNRARISERMKLLSIPEPVRALIYESKEITYSHALALADVKSHEFCFTLAQQIIKDALSVRHLETLITAGSKVSVRPKSSFKAIHEAKKPKGFDLIIKYRIDRPEDKHHIIKILKKKITELEAEPQGE